MKMVENLPAVGAHSAPPSPLADGEGLVLVALPQEPYSALGLRKFSLGYRPFGLCPNEKSWARPWRA